MKVYLVDHSAGQYSDHSSYISAVFDNRRDADAYAVKIKEYYESIERSSPPYPDIDLTEDQQKELYEWRSKKWAADDFNSATVTEMEVGEVEKRFVETS